MDTNVRLDVIKFFRSTLEDMKGDVNYAYPKRYEDHEKGFYDSSRGHAAFQMIGSKIETLNNFLDAIEAKPTVFPAIDERIGG